MEKNLIKYINCDIGTNSIKELSKGNTLPLLCTPFAMQALTLVNVVDRDSWIYNPNLDLLTEFRITQQPSPWIKDFGDISFMPVKNDFEFTKSSLTSAYKKIEFNPSEYVFKLLKPYVKCSITPSRYSFVTKVESMCQEKININFCIEKSDYEIVDSSSIKINCKKSQNRNIINKENFNKYYILKFSEDIVEYIFKDDFLLLKFNSIHIEYSITSSFISFEQAEMNYKNDLDDKRYYLVQRNAMNIWNDKLSNIKIEDQDEKKKEILYSNLYRTLIYPFNITEYNKNNEEVHLNFDKNEISKGVMITGIGFWDTYRTSFPLLSLLYVEDYKVFIEAMIVFYKDTGWLPRWLAPSEVGCMPSTMCDIALCEALEKNLVKKELIPLAHEALIKNAYDVNTDNLHGRINLKEFLEYHYIPYELGENSVTSTLDYAYCDYAIGKVLKKYNPIISEELYKRSLYVENIFCEKNQLFVAKSIDGSFRKNFDQFLWGQDYCESSSLQNCFNVPYNSELLIKLYGSKKEVKRKLNFITSLPPKHTKGNYDVEIHEQYEMNYTDLGQVAISNQPSFNILYTYLVIDEIDLFYKLRKDILKNFNASSNGYPGDEDNGSLSSWYLWTSLGLYPYEPTSNMLFSFSSVFDKVELNTRYGKIYKNNNDEFRTIALGEK